MRGSSRVADRDARHRHTFPDRGRMFHRSRNRSRHRGRSPDRGRLHPRRDRHLSRTSVPRFRRSRRRIAAGTGWTCRRDNRRRRRRGSFGHDRFPVSESDSIEQRIRRSNSGAYQLLTCPCRLRSPHWTGILMTTGKCEQRMFVVGFPRRQIAEAAVPDGRAAWPWISRDWRLILDATDGLGASLDSRERTLSDLTRG